MFDVDRDYIVLVRGYFAEYLLLESQDCFFLALIIRKGVEFRHLRSTMARHFHGLEWILRAVLGHGLSAKSVKSKAGVEDAQRLSRRPKEVLVDVTIVAGEASAAPPSLNAENELFIVPRTWINLAQLFNQYSQRHVASGFRSFRKVVQIAAVEALSYEQLPAAPIHVFPHEAKNLRDAQCAEQCHHANQPHVFL
ncbi:MAG TPA: hypothetical protein VMG82_24610 [Candidatus Sulfotelmatobacter sp.]|nr:hypothetical protein [Candidatus Sulfotelmatobacter sp.]